MKENKMKKSLKDFFKEGKLDELPTQKEALVISSNQNILTRTGWKEELTGKEPSFTITPDNFAQVVTVSLVKNGKFKRIPVTYGVLL